MAYRYLWTPLALGPVTVRNRIVFSAHLTNYARDGLPTEQHAAYYAARAAGGAGLIITEEHSTHPTDWPYEKLIHGFHRDVIPGYRRITDAVHRHRVPIFAQINHNGGQASSMYTRLPVWAPSAVADPLFREVPKAVTQAEIDEIVAGYAHGRRALRRGRLRRHRAAVQPLVDRARASSPRPPTAAPTTTAGALANRARLLLEIVAAVRRVIGTGLALGVRLCGDELIDGGTTIDEAVEVARMVEATGNVDYINTSIGVATATLFMIEASMHVPPGYAMFIPSAIRKAVDLPVVGVGRFKDPLQAERALAEGHCDLVGVVRGQIADADFAAKARAGATEDIRLCLSCNQECVGRMGLNRWLGCIENPRTGREASVAAPVPRRRLTRPGRAAGARGRGRARRAAGGDRRGRARARASRCSSATRGRRAGAAGGDVPNRAELGDMIRNQVAECRRLGVPIEYGVDADRRRRRGPRRPTTSSWPPAPWPAAVVGRARRHQRVRRPRRPHRRRQPAGAVVRDRRDRVPPRHVGRRAARRPRLPGRGRHAGHGRRPGPRHHARHGAVVDAGRRQGHRAVDRPRADGLRRHDAHAAPPPDRASTQERTPDWVVLAVPAAPAEQLYHDLRDAGGLAGRPRRRLRRAPPGPRRGRRGRAGRIGDRLRPRSLASRTMILANIITDSRT